jgi:hypothetical protein
MCTSARVYDEGAGAPFVPHHCQRNLLAYAAAYDLQVRVYTAMCVGGT